MQYRKQKGDVRLDIQHDQGNLLNHYTRTGLKLRHIFQQVQILRGSSIGQTLDLLPNGH